ncbi:hypothetical protein [Candidatus Thiosymbion oneisti]|uniref:hypothetical protein n=1 Tax=Candidatus Thiosymbion oneisti TaxID=589554 RepID=UPI000B7CA43F|nr:hypothetical protein [Candidatus Thiosymbion oneisti]
MAKPCMVLPSKDVGKIRLVTVPEDMSPHEAYRSVTGLIAEVRGTEEEQWVEEVLDLLEEHGFEEVDFVLGPPLD